MRPCLAALAIVPLTASATTKHRTTARTAAATYSGLDEQWLQTDMQGDRFEIAGGKLALRKSSNKAVRKLAATLIKDHTKSFKESSALAKKLGIEVPKSPTQSMQWELKTIAGMNGRAFDRAYSSLEEADHLQDISETTGEVKNGSNSEVVKDARQSLPMLHRHEKLAKAASAASR